MSTHVVGADLVVVGRIGERQREHPCFLRFASCDACERAGEHRAPAHVPRLHRRVLARRAFAVVLVADREPVDAGCLELAASSGNDSGRRDVDA